MITSLSNSRIKHLVTLREKSRSRNKEGLFIAEGIRMFGEAPQGKLSDAFETGKPSRQIRPYR